MSSVEKLVLAVIEDDYLLDRMIDSTNMFDNHDLAIDAAKKGYTPFLLALSSRDKIYNYTRAEALKYVSDPTTTLYILRDMISDMIEKEDNDSLLMISTSLRGAIINHYSEMKAEEMTLEEALSILDDDGRSSPPPM